MAGPRWSLSRDVPIAPKPAMMHLRLARARESMERRLLCSGAHLVLFREELVDLTLQPARRAEDGFLVHLHAEGWP